MTLMTADGKVVRPRLEWSMKSDRSLCGRFPSGACVSCGREPGRFYRSCPYCGEQVRQAGPQRAAAGALAFLLPSLLAVLIWQARPDLAAAVATLREMSAVAGWLLASGLGLLILPLDDHDRIVASRAAWAGWQAQAVGGAWAGGMVVVAVAVCLTHGASSSLGVIATALGLTACVCALPLLFRVSRQLWLAALLILAGWALV